MNQEADTFFKEATKWSEEYRKLREIILDVGLTEEFKWMHPCYTHKGKNIVLIHGFKGYCAILFFKGALLDDPDHILIQQTENVQAGRQVRFTTVEEIVEQEPKLKKYILSAIETEESGKKIEHKKTREYEVAPEFQDKLDKMPELKTAFEALTPGRQRAYLFYFFTAKRSKTREERINKYLGKILDGKGMDD